MLSKDICDNFKNKSLCFSVSLIVIMYFLKNADIIFVFSNIFFDFLVDNNLINVCVKYNVSNPHAVIILSQIVLYR